MRATPEFLKFANELHQDIFDIHESAEEAIETALQNLSMQEQEALRRFLESVIGSGASEHQLHGLWDNSGADFYLSDTTQARDFFTWIVSRIP